MTDTDTIIKNLTETLSRCVLENENLVRVLRFYAREDWRDITLMDRGEKARAALNEIMNSREPGGEAA